MAMISEGTNNKWISHKLNQFQNIVDRSSEIVSSPIYCPASSSIEKINNDLDDSIDFYNSATWSMYNRIVIARSKSKNAFMTHGNTSTYSNLNEAIKSSFNDRISSLYHYSKHELREPRDTRTSGGRECFYDNCGSIFELEL